MSARKLIFEGTAGDRLVARLELPVGEEPIAYALFAHCFTCAAPDTQLSLVPADDGRADPAIRFDPPLRGSLPG